MSKIQANSVSDDANAEEGTELNDTQPTAVLAQVAVMPDGQLTVALAEQVSDKVAFCLEVARMFLHVAGQQHVAEKSKQTGIVVAPPGMRVQ